GIRDFHVTGVQTCALPIYPRARTRRHRTSCAPAAPPAPPAPAPAPASSSASFPCEWAMSPGRYGCAPPPHRRGPRRRDGCPAREIGRASWRERAEERVVVG